MIFLLHIVLGFSIARTICSSDVSDAKVKVIPATYMQRIDGVTLYESHAKIVFKVQLPEFHPLQPGSAYCPEHPQVSKIGCELESAIQAMFLDYRTELELATLVLNNTSQRRKKRQVLIGVAALAGYFVHSVISKISNTLFGNENEIQHYVNNMQAAVKQEDRQNYILYHEVSEFATKMSEFQRIMIGDINKNIGFFANKHEDYISKLYRIMLLKIEHDHIAESIEACKRKQLPSKLVSIDSLVKGIKRLEKIQNSAGKVLAIPTKFISEYLKLPIFDCMYSLTYATVTVNVPLRRVESQWSLFKLYHHKFAFKGQTCQIYPSEPSFLATSLNRSVLISSHSLRDCSIEEHKLCLIPEYSIDSTQSLQCAVGILQGKATKELASACSFRCSSNSELAISEVEQNKIIITNADSVDVACPSGTKEFAFTKLGAIEVQLNCKCKVVVNKKVVFNPFYCLSSNELNQIQVFRTIPTLWSKLDYAFGTSEHVFLNHSDATLNMNWTSEIPVFNLSYKPVPIPEPFEEFSFNYMTFCIIVLAAFDVVVVLVLCCICKAAIL